MNTSPGIELKLLDYVFFLNCANYFDLFILILFPNNAKIFPVIKIKILLILEDTRNVISVSLQCFEVAK